MFERARVRGELRAGLEPALCAAMLFGAVEMSLTGFVAALLKGDDEGLAQAKAQLAETFLRGVLSPEASAQATGGPRLAAEPRPAPPAP